MNRTTKKINILKAIIPFSLSSANYSKENG